MMVLFDVQTALSALKTECIGRQLIYQEVTATTMNDAEQGARNHGHSHGTAYVADTQTNARGAKGHTWDGKTSGNLLLSLIIHRELSEVVPDDRSFEYDLDVAATLSITQALDEFGVKGTSVKWLNDLWIRGHKLVGALVEYKGKITTADNTEKHLYILGLGVNVNSDVRRDPYLGSLATSILCETGQPMTREALYAAFCYHLELNLVKSRVELMKLYYARQTFQSGDLLKAYFTNSAKEPLVCTFLGVQSDWSVNLQAPNEEQFNIACSEVSLRPQPDKVVYVYNEQLVATWSSEALLRTFKALVDTSKCDVKFIANVTEAIPSDCCLLVIGQLEAPPTNSLVQTVSEYVNSGGNCLCVGSACQLFSKEGIIQQSAQRCSIRNTTVINTKTGDVILRTVNILVVGQNVSASCNNVTAVTNSRTLAQHPVADSKDSDDALQSSNQNDSNYPKQTNQRTVPDITLQDYGKGKLCLCALNVEVTYADVDEVGAGLGKSIKLALKVSVHQRDALVLTVLNEFGL